MDLACSKAIRRCLLCHQSEGPGWGNTEGNGYNHCRHHSRYHIHIHAPLKIGFHMGNLVYMYGIGNVHVFIELAKVCRQIGCKFLLAKHATYCTYGIKHVLINKNYGLYRRKQTTCASLSQRKMLKGSLGLSHFPLFHSQKCSGEINRHRPVLCKRREWLLLQTPIPRH